MRHHARRTRAARLGMAYHYGRPEWESRRYVAERDPSPSRRLLRLAGLDIERAADQMRVSFAQVGRALARLAGGTR